MTSGFCAAKPFALAFGLAAVIGASIVHASSAVSSSGWSAPVLLDVGVNCHYHTVADINGDGRLDLIVPTRSTSTLHIFMNQGGGSFAADAPLASLGDILSVATADIDGDGDRDLLEVGFGTNTLRVRPNDGTGAFTIGQSISLAGHGHGIDTADFDADGWIDVVLTMAEGSVELAQVFWNNGGSLSAGPILSTQATPYYVTTADVDSDLDVDIVVSNRGSDSISVFRNDAASFTILPPFSADGSAPMRIEAVDIDVDGKMDLIVPHAGSYWASRFAATTGGAFTFVQRIQGTWTTGPMGNWIDSADLDLDGRLDLALAPAPIDGIGVCFQDALGGWEAVQPLVGGSNSNSIHVVDLNGDGTLDITSSAHDSRALVILFNNVVTDCNSNGIADAQDIAQGTSTDCNGNAVPDECDFVGAPTDCDEDGDPDACEIAETPSLDLDVDGILDACEVPGNSFCFGDGSLATPCPCAPPDTVPMPSGAAGHGCANSFNPGGALLSAYGITAPDAVVIHVDVAPPYSGFAFLVKGNAAAEVGVASADGVVCTTGAVVRFGGHNAGTNGNAIGQWAYPNAVQTIPISAATAQVAGQSAFYQLYYRNAVAGFCTPATANWSNAFQIDWPH